MFVSMKKLTGAALFGAIIVGTACTTAQASETGKLTGKLTVNLVGVQNSGGPLYVSVQARADFKQERGSAGGTYKNVKGGNLSYSYDSIPIGEYSVMIWHDTDNDGEFSKDENYMPLDGWGASGQELRGEPVFDDVKISIDATGTEVTITMKYPK